MSRRSKATKRGITPDPKYNSELVAKVIRSLMRSGKKTTSERIVYGAIAELGEKTGEDPIQVLDTAIANGNPVEVSQDEITEIIEDAINWHFSN